jgi:hypothetical protein
VALPALVLVHGGAHAADCWDLTVEEIRHLAPELTVLAEVGPVAMSRFAARLAFCNGMTAYQREFVLSRICGESIHLVVEKVDRSDLPNDVSWTWILTRRDRALSQRQQRRSMSALRGGGTVIPIDTCHDLMVSEPRRVAEILVDRWRLYSG